MIDNKVFIEVKTPYMINMNWGCYGWGLGLVHKSTVNFHTNEQKGVSLYTYIVLPFSNN